MNVLLLWGESIEKGYTSPQWVTYKQAEALGAHVRKGEHGALVVYADTFSKTEENEKGEEVDRAIPFMKGYTVFNVQQIEGLPARYYEPTAPHDESRTLELIEGAEAFFARTGATFRHGGNRAFYAPSADFIQLPVADAFRKRVQPVAARLAGCQLSVAIEALPSPSTPAMRNCQVPLLSVVLCLSSLSDCYVP